MGRIRPTPVAAVQAPATSSDLVKFTVSPS